MYGDEEMTNPKAPEGPGAELDRVLSKREDVRQERERLAKAEEELCAHAEKLIDVLVSQVHEPKTTPATRGDY